MSDYVVIPAHNEGKTIAKVLDEVRKYTRNIIVVDDGSTDNTAGIVKGRAQYLLRHEVNLGKGAALKTGCDFAFKVGATRIVVMDADGQHEPKEIPHFLKALNRADIVFGYRKQATTMPIVLKAGNRLINETLSVLFKIKVHDSQCGFRAFTAKSYPKIRWGATDYYMETEMIIKAGKHNLTSAQVPVETIYGDKYKGTTVKDGVIIVGKMFAWRLRR